MSQHTPGRPPEDPVPWVAFWIVCGVILAATFICAWQVGS